MAYDFIVVFSNTHRFLIVLNKSALWLQSRSCFTSNFCYLTLSSVYWNQGLVYNVLCSSRAEVVLGPIFVT